MNRIFIWLIAVLIASACIVSRTQAQGNLPLRVGTIERTPFVVKRGTGYIGYSIELWDAVAKELEITYELVIFDKFRDLLLAVENGEVDIAVANISITSSREEVMDFSHAIFNAGLQIMITLESERPIPVWQTILSSDVLQTFLYAGIVLIVVAHLEWLLEGRHTTEGNLLQDYLAGIGGGFWWAVVTVTTVGYGDKAPKTHGGRALAVIWMLASLFLLAVFIGQISSAFVESQRSGPISGPADLPGHRVATIGGSTADDYLTSQGIIPLRYNFPQDMIDSVVQGKADAAVFDAPILAYYAATDGRNLVKMVGPRFQQEKFGFALPENSPYLESVNYTLLKLQENGTYLSIQESWFRDDP